jgi:hypothetical protein
MARELVEEVFTSSLTGINKKVEAMVAEIRRLYQKKVEAGESAPAIKPVEVTRIIGTSRSSVSRWLRPAIDAGLLEVVSETAGGRVNLVKPGSGKIDTAFLPTVEKVAEAFPELAKDFRAVHPISGEEIVLAGDELAPVQENCQTGVQQ